MLFPGGSDNVDNFTARSSQVVQNDSVLGLYKGIVMDTRDPFQLGQVRVHCYGIHADYPGLDVSALNWAMVVAPLRGAFAAPKLFDRVWVTFDSGDRNKPVVVGYWYGIPTGAGSLPHNCTVGSEIRPENWLQHDLNPETIMLGCSGNGNGIWIEDKFISGDVLSSAIELEDTGGKYFQIKSYHTQNATNFDSESTVPADLYQASLPARKVLRDGITPVTDPISGEVSFGHQNIGRALLTDTSDFTLDSMVQYDSNGAVAANKSALSGAIIQSRQGKSAITQSSDALFLNSQIGIFAPALLTLPRRWDQ